MIGAGNITLMANWTANWKISDTTAPTCTLSATAGSTTITATASDTGGSGIAGKEFSTSYDGETTKTVSAKGTITYYVKDGVGNTGSCSATISGLSSNSYCPCGWSVGGGQCYTNTCSPNYCPAWCGTEVTEYYCPSGTTKLSSSYFFKAN